MQWGEACQQAASSMHPYSGSTETCTLVSAGPQPIRWTGLPSSAKPLGNLSQTHPQVCFLGDAEFSQASKEDSPLMVSVDHSKTTVASLTCKAVVWFTLPFCAAERHLNLTCPFLNLGWEPPPPPPPRGSLGFWLWPYPQFNVQTFNTPLEIRNIVSHPPVLRSAWE